MCGKYGGPAELAVHAGYLDVPPPFKNLNPGEEMRPMKMVSVFAKNAKGEMILKEMKWGLIPNSYAGFLADWKASTFHARLETVASTRSFEHAWRLKRRVIFPMDRYFEKTKIIPGTNVRADKALRVAITRADEKPLGVAGIYDFANTIEGPILSCAMLTRSPGPRMMELHDREPVVIEPENFQAWLDGSDDMDLETPWPDDAFNLALAA